MDTSFQKTAASDEWYTPIELIRSLGQFDLDPCAPMEPLWRTATRMVNKEEDGLKVEWAGRVWCNPPYSQPLLTQFCEKMAAHDNGILLLFSRTGNKVFQETLFPACHSIFFMRHRVRFYSPDGSRGGSPGCDSVLIAFGEENTRAIQQSGQEGYLFVNR